MPPFQMVTDLAPRGDQPQRLTNWSAGAMPNTRSRPFSVYRTGKTLTMARVIQAIQKPRLFLPPTRPWPRSFFRVSGLLSGECGRVLRLLLRLLPARGVPPRTDTYIEKDSDINEEVEKLRLSATRSLMERPDVIIVASVSCIYGMGSPHDYGQVVVTLNVGEQYRRQNVLRHLNDIQYERNNVDFKAGTYRVKGDVLDIFPAYGDTAIRIDFFGDEVDRIIEIDPLTGEIPGYAASDQYLSGEPLRDAGGAH